MAKFEYNGTVYQSRTDFVNRFAHESVTDWMFSDRLRSGWSAEKALTTPSRTRGDYRPYRSMVQVNKGNG